MDAHQKKRQNQKPGKSKAVKVVYISSPMKVKTSASKFRALVQELTGRDSDVARFMEVKGASASDDSSYEFFEGEGNFSGEFCPPVDPSDDASRESPVSSESLLESFEDLFGDESMNMDEGFAGLFVSSFLNDRSFHDGEMIRSFDAL